MDGRGGGEVRKKDVVVVVVVVVHLRQKIALSLEHSSSSSFLILP